MALQRIALAAFAAGMLASTAFAADPIKIGVTVAQSPPGSVSQGTQVKDAHRGRRQDRQ